LVTSYKGSYQGTGFSRAVIEGYKATLAAGLLIVLNQPAEQQPVMVVKQRTGRAVPMTSELANKIADE